VPDRARPCSASSKLASEERPELEHPAPDRLVGDLEPTLGEQVLDVAKAQREAKVQPDRVPDDLGWKTVARKGERRIME